MQWPNVIQSNDVNINKQSSKTNSKISFRDKLYKKINNTEDSAMYTMRTTTSTKYQSANNSSNLSSINKYNESKFDNNSAQNYYEYKNQINNNSKL